MKNPCQVPRPEAAVASRWTTLLPSGILYFKELPFHISGGILDRFEAMRTLLAAVDGGSLSAASRRLRTPLATVSRRVADLEAHLKSQLLIRSSRLLSLTEAGHAYVAVARRILDELDDAERAAAGEYSAPRGHLTITAPVMFGRLHVAPVILAFLKSYPDITARLALADHVINLIDEHADVAVRIGRLADSSMVAARLGQVRWVTCASPAYLKAKGQPATPADLDQHDCIAFEGVYSSASWNFGSGGQQLTVPIHPRLAVNTADAAISAAMAGAGITRVLSYQVAAPVETGALALILSGFEPNPLPVHLVYAPQVLLPLKLRVFLDFAAPRLRDRLQA
jgi:DNA-binding transcriptional LysR family regulator